MIATISPDLILNFILFNISSPFESWKENLLISYSTFPFSIAFEIGFCLLFISGFSSIISFILSYEAFAP